MTTPTQNPTMDEPAANPQSGESPSSSRTNSAPDTRSSSPSKRQTTNILGLGLPDLATPSKPMTILSEYPHLGHYVYNLLATAQISTSPPKAQTGSQHPLSVSSSGESDEEDEGGKEKGQGGEGKKPDGIDQADKDSVVKRIVELLDNEEEEEVKEVLKPYMGDLAKVRDWFASLLAPCLSHGADEQDDILMDQVCLDCMHRRRGESPLRRPGTLSLCAPPPPSFNADNPDDIEGAPYAPHLTPARARASPSLNASHPLRPYTPTRVPSFRARTPLGRPQSPSLPPTASGQTTPNLQRTMSSLGREAISMPLTSTDSGASSATSPPKNLSARASAFSPAIGGKPAPLSSTATTFNPSDPWKDAPSDPPRSASPFGAIGAHGMVRTSSNLAIASPIILDKTSPFHSPLGTPARAPIKMPDVFSSPSEGSSLHRKSIVPDDDDDDDFSPFGTGLPKLNYPEQGKMNYGAKPFEPSLGSAESAASFGSHASQDSMNDGSDEIDMGSGMTPLDVLSSVFSTVARTELEDALVRANYDFESAMAILVSHFQMTRSGASTPGRIGSPRPALLGIGTRGGVSSGHFAPREGYFTQGGRSFSGHHSPGLGTRSPGGQGTRMCRYFLAGECRRADCRFRSVNCGQCGRSC